MSNKTGSEEGPIRGFLAGGTGNRLARKDCKEKGCRTAADSEITPELLDEEEIGSGPKERLKEASKAASSGTSTAPIKAN